MRDNLFDEKIISDIKKKTAAPSALVSETKKMMEKATDKSEITKEKNIIHAFIPKIAKVAAAACVLLLCVVAIHQTIKPPDGEEPSQLTQSADNGESKKPDDETGNIAMVGGEDDSNILLSLNAVGMSELTNKTDTLKEMTEESDEIVKGTIIDCATHCNEELGVYTIYHVYVEKAYKGSLERDYVITVVVPGGIVAANEYIRVYGKTDGVDWEQYTEEELAAGYVEYMREGDEPVEEGEYCLLMLGETELNESLGYGDEIVYSVIGNYRGRFIIDGKNVTRCIPEYEEDKINIKRIKKLEEKIKEILG